MTNVTSNFCGNLSGICQYRIKALGIASLIHELGSLSPLGRGDSLKLSNLLALFHVGEDVHGELGGGGGFYGDYFDFYGDGGTQMAGSTAPISSRFNIQSRGTHPTIVSILAFSWRIVTPQRTVQPTWNRRFVHQSIFAIYGDATRHS